MKFYDLCINSALSSGKDEPGVMVDLALELGFDGIFLADFMKVTPKAIKNIRNKYADQCSIYTRVNLIPKSKGDLKKWVKRLRNQVDIIAVRSGTREKKIYVNAILDKRVDIISLTDIREFECLDYAHFKMALKHHKMVEVTTRNLLLKGGVQRSKLMRQMSKSCAQIIRSKVPLIISSGARSKWELRAPRELIALVELVNIPKAAALAAISKHPETLIEKIKIIRDPNHIMAGVHVISLEKEEEKNGG